MTGPRQRFSRLSRFLGIVLVLHGAQVSAEDLDRQLEPVVSAIVSGMEKAKAKRLTVADFTNPQDEITELGKYIAGKLETRLHQASKEAFEVIDRRSLRKILAERALLDQEGLLDPKTVKELRIAGVEAIVTGQITPLGDAVELNVKAISTETAKLIASADCSLARTKGIDYLLGQKASEPNLPDSGKKSPSSPPPRPGSPVFEDDYQGKKILRISVRSLKYRERSFRGNELAAVILIENVGESDMDATWGAISLINEDGDTWEGHDSEEIGVRNGGKAFIGAGRTLVTSVKFYKRAGGTVFDLTGRLLITYEHQKLQSTVSISGITAGELQLKE